MIKEKLTIRKWISAVVLTLFALFYVLSAAALAYAEDSSSYSSNADYSSSYSSYADYSSSYSNDMNSGNGISYPRPSGDPPLEKGARGDEVRWLQAALNDAIGAGLVVDGDFGGKTADAISSFQSQQGLQVTGTADQETIYALCRIVEPEAVTEAAPVEQVTEAEVPESDKMEVLVEVNTDPEHIFLNYWSTFFRFIPKIFTDTDMFLKYCLISLAGAAAFGFVLPAILLLPLVFKLFSCIRTEQRGYTTRTDPETGEKMIVPNILIWFGKPTKQVGGCYKVIAFIAMIGILASPLMSDFTFLSMYFNLGIWGCIWRVVLYAVLRILLSIVLFFVVTLLMSLVIAAITSLPAYLVAEIRAKRRSNLQNSRNPSLTDIFIKLTTNDAVMTIGMILSGIVILYLNYLPIVMSINAGIQVSLAS